MKNVTITTIRNVRDDVWVNVFHNIDIDARDIVDINVWDIVHDNVWENILTNVSTRVHYSSRPSTSQLQKAFELL